MRRIIRVDTNAQQLLQGFQELSDTSVKVANRRAVGDVTKRVFTETKREGAKQLKMPQWMLVKRLRVTMPNRRRDFGIIDYDLRGVPFIDLNYLALQQKKGVRVGNRFFKGMFLAQVDHDHVGIFTRHDKSSKRRSTVKREVRVRRKFTGQLNKNPGKKYRAALPIKEPTKNLRFLSNIIEIKARNSVRNYFPRRFQHHLEYQMRRLLR